MLDLLLINPPVYTNDEGIFPPLGLLSIATYLKKFRFNVDILDIGLSVYTKKMRVGDDFYDQVAKVIFSYQTQIIGISCQNYTLSNALNIAKKVKEIDAHKKIILGGPGVHGLGENILKEFNYIDYIVSGEGEKAISFLLNCILRNDETIPVGVGYLDENGIYQYKEQTKLINPLDSLPFPDFEIIHNVEDYFKINNTSRRALNVELARGCSGGCEFCGCFSFWCGQHRYFSVDYVFENICNLYDKYRINHLYISDDNFMENRMVVMEVCKTFQKINLPITWDTRGRIDELDDELLKEMRDAGCTEILLGLETSDDDILEKMNKKISSSIQYKAIKKVMDVGIIPILSLILGYEDETPNSINKTLMLLIKLAFLNKPMAIYFHMLSIVPGTRLYNEKKNNLDLEYLDERLKKIELGNSKILPQDVKLIKTFPSIFSTFYYVKSNIDIKKLISVAAYAPILCINFPYTLYLVNSLALKLFDFIVSLPEEHDDTIKIINFLNEINKKFEGISPIQDMLKYEYTLYQAKSCKNEVERFCIVTQTDIMHLRNEIKCKDCIDIRNQKCQYLIKKEESKIRVFQSY